MQTKSDNTQQQQPIAAGAGGDPFADLGGPAHQQAPQPKQAPPDPFADLSGPKQGVAASNSFSPLVPAQQPPSSQEGEGSAFNDRLDIFNRGFERFALGGLQLMNAAVRQTAGNLPFIGGAITKDTQALDQHIKAVNDLSEVNYLKAYDRTPSPITDAVGRIGGAALAGAPGTMAAAAAVPDAAATGIAAGLGRAIGSTAGQGAASGASAGAMEYAPTPADRAINTGLGAAVGGAVGGAVQLGSALARTVFPKIGSSSMVQKIFNPQGAAAEDIAGSVVADAGNDVGAALSKVQKLEKAGTQGMTPGEALGGTVTRSREASIRASDLEKSDVAGAMQASQNPVKQNIFDTVRGMATSETKATQKSAFDKMKEQFVSPTGEIADKPITQEVSGALGEKVGPTSYIPDVINSNKVLKGIYQDVQNSSSEAWSSLPNNSVAKLHKVVDTIDDSLYKATPNPRTGAIEKDINPDEYLSLIEAKKQLTGVLKQSPEFVQAMESTRAIKTQEYYQELLSTKKAAPGQQGKLNLNEMFDAIMPTRQLQNKFVKDVAATGGDPRDAVKLIQVADSLRTSPLNRILKRADEGGDVFAVYGRDIGMVQKFFNKASLETYRKAMLDVTLSGDKWAKEVGDVLRAKQGISQQTKFLNLIKDASPEVGRGAVNATSTGMSNQVTGDRNEPL